MRIGGDPRGDGRALKLPCGKCVGCRKKRARSWTVRLLLEAQMHEQNRFVTLTYKDEKLPENKGLRYRDVQLFLKRVRKRGYWFRYGPHSGVRFFCAAEYGSSRHRPHYHLLLYNFKPQDEEVWQNGSRFSKSLEDLWGSGTVDIGDVSPASCAYVAGYAGKKGYGRNLARYEVVDTVTGEVTEKRREFCHMSKGIGAGVYAKYPSDFFPADLAIVDGNKYQVPRYFYEKLRKSNPDLAEEISHRRYEKAKEYAAELTAERLAVREAVETGRDRFFDKRMDL